MSTIDDILNLELMFGVGCCDCLDIGRPRLSPHPLQVLGRTKNNSIQEVSGYVELDLETGEITCKSYKD